MRWPVRQKRRALGPRFGRAMRFFGLCSMASFSSHATHFAGLVARRMLAFSCSTKTSIFQ